MRTDPGKEAYLRQALQGTGIRLPEEAVAKLVGYGDAVLAANVRTNLTAARSWEELVDRHIMDCLAGISITGWQGVEVAVDVGSGAGLPGMVLAIAQPAVRVRLVEARRKKANFLRECALLLGLNNVEVAAGRAEDLGRDGNWREGAQRVLARGVAPLAVLLEYTLPFLAVGGWLLAWKGPALPAELEEAEYALQELRAAVVADHRYRLADGRQRHLLVVAKLGETPPAYPRRAGLAAKRPLRRHLRP